MLSKLFLVLLTCLLVTLSQSCTQINVKKITYQALRKHDCRVNEPNAFCNRNYSVDFQEYERMRQNFLSDKQTSQYQVMIADRQSEFGNSVQ